MKDTMQELRYAGMQAQGRAAYEYWLEYLDPGWVKAIPWEKLAPVIRAHWIALVEKAGDAFLDAYILASEEQFQQQGRGTG